MSRHGDRRGQIADFRDSFETINWLYLLFKCGIKAKTHFEWLLWHWSSLGQLNLEPTWPNCLVGCKVPTDLVKISVKEATHMGFHYIQWYDYNSDWGLHHWHWSNHMTALVAMKQPRRTWVNRLNESKQNNLYNQYNVKKNKTIGIFNISNRVCTYFFFVFSFVLLTLSFLLD